MIRLYGSKDKTILNKNKNGLVNCIGYSPSCNKELET
jgi:hypothetical protein